MANVLKDCHTQGCKQKDRTYMAHGIPCFAKADEIGVSGSIAKYGTSPTITTDTAIYNAQQIAKATPIPNGRSLCGFFTCKGQKRVKLTLVQVHGLWWIGPFLTSSAVLATISKPMYAKKTVADPASIPFTPYGKYLESLDTHEQTTNQIHEMKGSTKHLCITHQKPCSRPILFGSQCNYQL